MMADEQRGEGEATAPFVAGLIAGAVLRADLPDALERIGWRCVIQDDVPELELQAPSGDRYRVRATYVGRAAF